MTIDRATRRRLWASMPIALGIAVAATFAAVFAAPALRDSERYDLERERLELAARACDRAHRTTQTLLAERDALRADVVTTLPQLDSATLALFQSTTDGLLQLHYRGPFASIIAMLGRVDAGRALKLREFSLTRDAAAPDELVLTLTLEPVFPARLARIATEIP